MGRTIPNFPDQACSQTGTWKAFFHPRLRNHDFELGKAESVPKANCTTTFEFYSQLRQRLRHMWSLWIPIRRHIGWPV